MTEHDTVNILLVDDQPSKLLTYEAILHDLGDHLLKASSGREALEHLLKSEIAVILVDVCMPDLDGFQLAAMIREHPRFQKTAMIFISAIHLTDMDRLRGYEMGAVDYVPVPVIPEVLRAKVKVFAELYRKTRQLERMNAELEARVSARTAELEASTDQLLQSEQRRSLALVAGNMGSWDWDCRDGDCLWDDGQCRIFGVDHERFSVTPENVRTLVHPDDWTQLQAVSEQLFRDHQPTQKEFRVKRPSGEIRWCLGTAAPTLDEFGHVVRVSGVTVDITERKEGEERQALLAREVDHRAKNALALVQSIVRLTRASTVGNYSTAVEGRIKALSRAHTVLSLSRWHGADLGGLVAEELAPYRIGDVDKVTTNGPNVMLEPSAAQSLALALHELVTNAAKYGALSSVSGRVAVKWELKPGALSLHWSETGGPATSPPASPGFGTRIITASVQGQLGGEVVFDWRPDGLQCRLSVPRTDAIGPTNGNGGRDRRTGEESVAWREIAAEGNRVMILEDEALVAMALSESMTELGYSVVGPYSRIAEARAALKKHELDAAILDINVGGDMVYPLADILIASKVPFIFVTGYGAEGIDRRFANIPVLQKPIEREALQSIFRPRVGPAIQPLPAVSAVG